MPSHAATFEINMKNRQALSAITELKRSVHHLASDINSELAKTAGSFISFEAIKSLIESTVEYGHQIHKVSENLKIAAEDMQTLKMVARDAGKDFTFIEKAMTNLAKSRGLALGNPKGAQGKAFANLGIGADEIQHGHKIDVLSDLMRGAAQRPDKGFSDLSALFGSKIAQTLTNPTVASKLRNFSEFRNEKIAQGAIASEKNIDAVTEAKEAFEDLTDIIRVGLMPALAAMIEFLTSWFANKINNEKDITEMDKEAEALTINKGKKMPSGWQRFKAEMKLENTLTGIPFGSDEEKKQLYAKAKEDYITSLYGQDTYMELMKTHKAPATFMDDFKKRQEERRKEREKQRTEPENVQPTVKGAPASHKIEELKTDAFIKIGGLMTADTHYRVDRLQYEMADSAKRTADNSDTMVEQLDELIGAVTGNGFEAGM